jgi:O-antigen/teichoic acid export membrane protein
VADLGAGTLAMTEQPAGGLRVLAGQSLAYLAGGLAGKALALITVPVLARLLLPAQLGTLDVVASVASAFSIVAIAGTDNAVARFIPTERSPSTLWASAFLAVAVLGAVLFAIAAVASRPIAQLLLSDREQGGLIVIGLLYGIGATAFVALLNVLRVRQASRRYAATTTLVLVGQMAGAVALAAIDAGIGWILLWWGAASLAGGAWILVSARPSIARPDPGQVRRLLGFGVPLVPAVLGWVLGDLAIRAVLAGNAPLQTLGDYSIANRIVSVMALLISGFSLAWMPFIFRLSAHGNPAAQLRDAAVGLTSLLGLLAVLLGSFAPEAVAVLGGDAYADASVAVAPLAAGMLAFGLFSLLAGAAGLAMRTVDVAAASLAGVATQVIVALSAVPTQGLLGAGIASAAGYAVATAWLYWRTGGAVSSWPMLAVLVLSAAGLVVSSVLEQMGAGIGIRVIPPTTLALGIALLIAWYRRAPMTQPTAI